MARPPLPESERRSQVLQLRLTKAEREFLDEAAEALGVTITDLIRDSAMREAARLLLTDEP